MASGPDRLVLLALRTGYYNRALVRVCATDHSVDFVVCSLVSERVERFQVRFGTKEPVWLPGAALVKIWESEHRVDTIIAGTRKGQLIVAGGLLWGRHPEDGWASIIAQSVRPIVVDLRSSFLAVHVTADGEYDDLLAPLREKHRAAEAAQRAQEQAAKEEARRAAEEKRARDERTSELVARYNLRFRESEVEMALRRALPPGKLHVVALTDDERSQVRRCPIAKALHRRHAECWSRMVWPGLGVGEFAYGVAPEGRSQYFVRFDAAVTLSNQAVMTIDSLGPPPPGHSPDGSGGSGVGWASEGWGSEFVLRLPDQRTLEEECTWTWPVDVWPPPPGYPVGTTYERQIRNIRSRPTLTFARSRAGALYAQRLREAADARSLATQKANARTAEFAGQRLREAEAQRQVADLVSESQRRDEEARRQVAELVAAHQQRKAEEHQQREEEARRQVADLLARGLPALRTA